MNSEFGKGLSHQHRGYSVAAPDVGDAGTAFELGNDPLQCWKPLADEMVLIAGTEKPRDGTEQARRLVAPGDAATVFESRLHLVLVAGKGDHGVERADHVDRLSSIANTMACSGGNVNFCVAGS
jgi:hypothetical protein